MVRRKCFLLDCSPYCLPVTSYRVHVICPISFEYFTGEGEVKSSGFKDALTPVTNKVAPQCTFKIHSHHLLQ